LSEIKKAKLKNGWEMYHQSDLDIKILSREFGEDNIYDRHGIALNDGDCVFDIGANIGSFLLYIGSELQSAKVFCFEPIPETFAVLEKNASLVSHLDINLHNLGVADSSRTTEFTIFDATSVSSTMYEDSSAERRRNDRKFIAEELKSRNVFWKVAFDWSPRVVWLPFLEAVRRFHSGKSTVECQLRSLSEIIDENFVKKIDLLKIDVEGAEWDVIAGMRDHHWSRVKQLVMETHNGIEDARRIESKLQEIGFETKLEPGMAGVDHLFMIFAKRQIADTESSKEREPALQLGN